MGQDLKAENLTISIPYNGCDKNCPYCISKMTGYIKTNRLLFKRNLETALFTAKQAEVTSILITGKGEPALNMEMLSYLMAAVSKYNFPIELQTNGKELNNNLVELNRLFSMGLNVLAVSIDNTEQLLDYVEMFERSIELGLVVRITVNVTKLLGGFNFKTFLGYCKEFNIQQLTLRKIISPQYKNNNSDEKKFNEIISWIEENAPLELYEKYVNEAKEIIRNNGILIRNLPHTQIYDLDGVSFSYSDFCIQEKNNGDNIRSLVFQEDGHLYTSWNSKASILF